MGRIRPPVQAPVSWTPAEEFIFLWAMISRWFQYVLALSHGPKKKLWMVLFWWKIRKKNPEFGWFIHRKSPNPSMKKRQGETSSHVLQPLGAQQLQAGYVSPGCDSIVDIWQYFIHYMDIRRDISGLVDIRSSTWWCSSSEPSASPKYTGPALCFWCFSTAVVSLKAPEKQAGEFSDLSRFRKVWVPSGKLLHNYGKSPCYQWENPL